MTEEDDQSWLRTLRLHWECWYDVSFEHGCWTAVRLDNPDSILSAPSGRGLREQMREDHAQRMTASNGFRAAEGGSL